MHVLEQLLVLHHKIKNEKLGIETRNLNKVFQDIEIFQALMSRDHVRNDYWKQKSKPVLESSNMTEEIKIIAYSKSIKLFITFNS